MRGAGLAGDAIAGDLGFGRRPAGQNDHLQHPANRARGVRADHRTARDRAIDLEQRHGLQLAVGREHRVRSRQLKQVDRNAVSEGHGRLLDRTPALGRPQSARHFARKTGHRRGAEAGCGKRLPHRLGRQRERNLRGPDVRRFLDDLLDGQRSFAVCIVDGGAADREGARRGVDDRTRTNLAGVERGGDRERLQRRSRLEGIDQRAIAHLVARDANAIVRVVARPIGQRQNLAGPDVKHDHRTGVCLVGIHRCLDFAKRKILKAAVDRQRQIAPFLRCANALHVLDDLAAAVDDHAPASSLAAEPGLLRQLQAFLAHVMVTGKTDDVAHHLPARVIAPVFVLVMHALDLERGRSVGNFGCDRFFHVDKVTALSQFLIERRRRHLQRSRERAQLIGRRHDLVRPSPNRLHRRADRERIAETVDDAASMRRNVDLAAVARAALLLQKVVVDALQVERAAKQSQQKDKQAPKDQRRAKPRKLRRRICGRVRRALRLHRRSRSRT